MYLILTCQQEYPTPIETILIPCICWYTFKWFAVLSIKFIKITLFDMTNDLTQVLQHSLYPFMKQYHKYLPQLFVHTMYIHGIICVRYYRATYKMDAKKEEEEAMQLWWCVEMFSKNSAGKTYVNKGI